MKAFFSAGQWHTSSRTEAVHNPWTGEHLADVCIAHDRQVTAALDTAHAAFTLTRKATGAERSALLTRIADLIASRRSDFAATIVAEAGKPITLAEAETDRAVLTFRFAAALALADNGSGLAVDASTPGAGHFGLTRRFPLGVILGITPFNFPLNLVAHKVAPCVATGNTMLLKPALKTPLSSLLLAEVLEEAGVPSGQINTIPFGHEFIDPLLSDDRIRMVSFTGSVDVGWSLRARAVRQRVVLELGGNAAVVVEPDCDWRSAIPLIAAGAFGYAGQSCISVQRILVHEAIAVDFTAEMVRMTKGLGVGDPTDRGVLVGPMINRSAREKILGWIDKAVARGAELLTPIEQKGESLLAPIVLTSVPVDCEIVAEEVFAPVAVISTYSSFDEALDAVNASQYAIHAGVFTNDLRKSLQAFEEIEAGGVLINQVPTFRVENMPYGGVRRSGAGREGVAYAMEEMTDIRSLVIRR